MDCLLSRLPPSLRSLVESCDSSYTEHAPIAAVALVSLLAVYLGILYIRSQREAAELFNVPLPKEVRDPSSGIKWEDVKGKEKQILEDQVRGVSVDAGRAVLPSYTTLYPDKANIPTAYRNGMTN